MKVKLKRKLLLAGLALALLSQPAMAAKMKFHEEEWKETKAYGKILISEDSHKQWGPWTEFVQPAAGPIPIAALPGIPVNGTQYFRPESADEYHPRYSLLGEDFCQAGEWCGYIAYEYGEYQYEENDEWYGPFSGRIALRLTPDDPEQVTVDGGEGPGMVSYRLVNLAGNPVYQSGNLDARFGVDYEGGLGDFEAWIEEREYIWGEHPFPWATMQLTWGEAEVWTEEYVNGGYAATWAYGSYVAGITTPLIGISNLQAGNVTADYYGYSSGWWGNSSPVYIEVSFGPGTWSGIWNNGSDGIIDGPYTDSNGTVSVHGQVGFYAGGDINGADIISDPAQFSADDGTIDASRSVVQGNFAGDNAAALIGIADITKTKNGHSVNGIINTTTTVDSYGTARYVDTFATCKECD